MKVFLLFIGVLFLSDYAYGANGQSNVRAIDDFSESLRKFAGYMYTKIRAIDGPDGNIFFSPLSIAETLGLVMAGASGNTFTQLEEALLVNPKRNYSIANYNNLFRKIYNKIFNVSRNSVTKALMASRMFVSQEFDIHEEYVDVLQKFFDAGAQEMDFGNTNQASQIINDWVSEKTGGLIEDLIDPSSLNGLTRLVLVNALYFKASWENKMTAEGDHLGDQTFHTFGGEKQVPFIGQDDQIKYNYEEGVQSIAIPYENEEAYLVIMMPKDQDAWNEFVRWANLARILRDLPRNLESGWTSGKVNLSIPMFEVQKKLDMKPILRSMRVKDLFDDSKADLSKISEEKLHVSMFTHQAKVTVDERGTTAAAATGVVVVGRSSFTHNIIINRPFVFGIYRRSQLLFFGQITDPTPPVRPVDNEENEVEEEE